MTISIPKPSSRAQQMNVAAASVPHGSIETQREDSTQISRDELVDALNELLEAERAGARVAMETVRDIPASALADLVQDIHKDEVRWCSMLMRSIKSFEGAPSSATGAFWGKAMAIPDLDERLSFLNRGQAWVVRRLQSLIPRVQDAQIRTELMTMLEAHHKNIELVDARATTGSSASDRGHAV